MIVLSSILHPICDRGTVLLSREAHSYEYDNNGNIVYVILKKANVL